MQTYHYRAVSESGKVRTGRTEALNLADLESRLAQIKLELIEDPATVRDLLLKQIREEQYNYERRKQTMFYQGRPPLPPR